MTYDPKCYDLAEYFLIDDNKFSELDMKSLAGQIQQLIEDFMENEPEPRFDTRRDRDEWRHEAAEQQRLK